MFVQFPDLMLRKWMSACYLRALFFCMLGLLFFAPVIVQAQPPAPHLVKDLNASTGNSKPEHFTSVGSALYFVANDGMHGPELWKTDGNENGTALVKDINPGNEGSEPDELFDFKGTLFFSAKDSNNDYELWRSDGTATGTIRVMDINATGSSSPSEFVVLNNTLYFTADDGVHGNVLWRSDGTEANTKLVKDLYPGNLSASITHLTVVNGIILFAVYEPGEGVYGIWHSDGTANGTTLLKNINLSDAQNLFEEHTVLNNTLYFATQNSLGKTYLWRSDGTTGGTEIVSEITVPDSNYDTIMSFTVVGDTLYFMATNGPICGLWKSNGTPLGTAVVTNTCVGSSLIAVNNTLYFIGSDATTGYELWKSDGTPAGTGLFKDIEVGADNSYLGLAGNVDGTLYFFVSDFLNDDQTPGGLWRSDGTVAGTTLVKRLDHGGIYSQNDFIPFVFYNWNGVAYFSAEDGQNLEDNDSQNGYEPWKSDGTFAGTVLVKDINTITNNSYPDQLTIVGDSLYFLAQDVAHGQELWTSDGTAAGTALLSDINPGGVGSPIKSVVGSDHLAYLRVDNSPTMDLWRSDGTITGTLLLKQFAGIDGMITAGDMLYFVTVETGVGKTLWKSDGTVAGTVPIKAFSATDTPSIQFLLTHQGILYFNLTQQINAENQNQIWRSDGTANGTDALKDGAAGWMIADGNTIYFSNTNPDSIWKSDGTAAGTVLLVSVAIDYYARPTILNGILYFQAYDNTHGWELWKSDGTGVGTLLVKDIQPGVDASEPGYYSGFVVMNNQLYFGAKDGLHGANLWKSDGTEAGTVLVKAIFSPGRGPYDLTVINDHLYFLDEQDNGNKLLWVSDGTAAGTQSVMDLHDSVFGFPPDYHVNLVGAKERIFFPANEANTGVELWTLTKTGVVMAANDGYTLTQGQALTVTAPGLLSNDQDENNDHLSATLQTNPVNGAVTLQTDGSFVYRPFDTFAGTDTFTYRVSNSSAVSATALVSLSVLPTHLANNDTITVTVTGPVAIDVLANDGADLKIIAITQPTHGTAQLVDNKIVYTPVPDFNGNDSFTYTVSDGKGASASASVTITVRAGTRTNAVFLPLVRR